MRLWIFQAILALAVAAAWVAPGRTEEAPGGRTVRLGYLAPLRNDHLIAAFAKGLHDLGYVEGRNLAIDYRFAEGKAERLDPLAAELVRRAPDAVVTVGNPATFAMKRATVSIPVVFAPVGDAPAVGLVQSLARPGGNLTGVSIVSVDLGGKRLEILRETIPGIRRIAILGNGGNPSTAPQWQNTRSAADRLGTELQQVFVRGLAEIEAGLAEATKEGAVALVVLSDADFDSGRRDIVKLAVERRLPAIYEHRAFVEVGGLMSYGPNIDQMSYRAAAYVDKILKGARPGDLPVEQPTAFELVINLAAARTIGLAIPQSLLARADEVIE